VLHPEFRVKETARKLYASVWRPLEPLLGAARHILVSPDGQLQLVPFAALVDDADTYLIERYTLTYLASGRDLLRLAAQVPSHSPPAIIAGPDFDTVADGSQAAAAPAVWTVRADDARPSAAAVPQRWAPLRGAAAEGQAIAAVLGARLPAVTVVTGAAATEGVVKGVRGPPLLHIATHGWFAADEEEAPPPTTRGGYLLRSDGASVTPSGPPRENPLLRSWLVFAGANQRQEAPADDGLLTALEASGLDLWGTQLVVLSACETGRGEVRTGDGVYGLRRALVLAGAEAQVVTLWSVSDEPTRELMEAYYRRLLAGAGRSEGLRQTQLACLGSADRHHPFYWAGVVPVGDWRPLHLSAPGS
jgi:CHAT domain-containing protein